jgi:thioredoxin 1
MLNRRYALAVLIAGAAMIAAPVHAIEKKPFDAQAFAAAQAAGRPILVEVSAPWCPICKAQAPILAGLAAKPMFKNLAVFEVDFDSRKDVLRTFGVQRQSTLIVFKGSQEMGRSTGDTNAASIESLLAKSL